MGGYSFVVVMNLSQGVICCINGFEEQMKFDYSQ